MSPRHPFSEQLVRSIPLDKLRPAEDNFDRHEGDVSELAETIKTVGVLEPLIVVARNGSFDIVAGSRRYAAAKLAGEKAVPAIVREQLDERTLREIRLIENLQRQDLAALEEAESYKGLIDLGFTQTELAARVGRSQGHISKRLALLELPEKAKNKLHSGGITVAEAVELTKLVKPGIISPRYLEEAVNDIQSGGYDAADAVRHQLRERTRDDKAAQAKRELKDKGVAIVAWPKHGSWWSRKERPLKGGHYGIHHDPVPLTAAEHANEPCHAATVDSVGVVHYLCTKPSRHKTKGRGKAQATEKERAARSERRTHLAELRAANEDRNEFIKKLLQRKVARADALEMLVFSIAAKEAGDSLYYRAAELACSWLGIKLPAAKPYSYESSQAAVKLAAFADRSDDDVARVGLAMALAFVEEEIGRDYWEAGDRLNGHFNFLENKGYDRTRAERLQIAGRAPRGA